MGIHIRLAAAQDYEALLPLFEDVDALHRQQHPERFQKLRRFAHIDEIVVKAAHRGRGVGHLLMEQAEAWAKRRGAESIELGVYEFNQQAQEFYRDLGYSTFHRQMGKDLRGS